MREVNYEALREAAQNYQSTLAWYQAIPDSPNAERDCDAALAAFKRHIRHREADIIADLLDGLEEAKSQLNEQREYYEGVISDGSKRIAALEARQKRFPLKFPPTKSFLKFRQNQPLSGAHIPVSVTQLALALAGVLALPVVVALAEHSCRYQHSLPIWSTVVLQVVSAHFQSSDVQSLWCASRGKCGTAQAVATGIYHSRRTARIHCASAGTLPSRHPP